MKAWYLLYCKPRNELRAQQNLALQTIESYLPMFFEHKTSRTGKSVVSKSPLFPSYLFIHFDPLVTSVSRIHSTRGVNRIVGCREDMTAIDDSVMQRLRIRELAIDNAIVEIVAQAPIKGDRVRFTEGPFENLEGVFDENCGNKRCQVLFDIMGQSKRIEVSVQTIERVCA